MATAGADGRIAIWTTGRQQPDLVLEGHRAPIAALAVSPDGAMLASASWDHTVRLWSLADGAQRVLEGHSQNVNGVAFAPDGKSVVSAGYDLTLRIWRLPEGVPDILTLPSPINAVAVMPDGEIATGTADGKLRMLSPKGTANGEVQALPTPIVALAKSDDGALIAAAGIDGTVAIIDCKARSLLRVLAGSGLPVWAVAFLPDGQTLLTGGADGKIRRWNALTGDPVGSNLPGQPADFARRLRGRSRGGSVQGVRRLSHAVGRGAAPRRPDARRIVRPKDRLAARLPLLRCAEDDGHRLDSQTVAKLFEVGPNAYTPGTKMPEQRIGSAEDRRALTDFLARATAK